MRVHRVSPGRVWCAPSRLPWYVKLTVCYSYVPATYSARFGVRRGVSRACGGSHVHGRRDMRGASAAAVLSAYRREQTPTTRRYISTCTNGLTLRSRRGKAGTRTCLWRRREVTYRQLSFRGRCEDDVGAHRIASRVDSREDAGHGERPGGRMRVVQRKDARRARSWTCHSAPRRIGARVCARECGECFRRTERLRAVRAVTVCTVRDFS